MRMLMLGWELPPHNSGGLGVACYYLSRALAHQGAKIDFILPYSATHPDVDYMAIHPVTTVTPKHQPNGCGAYQSAMANEQAALSGIRQLQYEYVQFIEQFVAQHSIDVIHAHDWLTMEAGMRAKQLTNKPLIVHVHATEFDRSGEHSGNPLVHEIEQSALLVADKILAVSAITKNIIVREYGIPPGKVEVVHNAIDPSSILPHNTQDEATYRYLDDLKQAGHTVVAAITRFTVQKGLDRFLKAAQLASQKHPKLAFLLAGDGEQREQLIEQAAQLGIADKVFFTGFVRGQQWRDAYRVADIFVMSSVSEPFGLTALEAACYKTALLVSWQSGVGEVLDHALRFDYWDEQALAEHIVGLARSPARLAALQQASAMQYQTLTWQSVASQCMELYQRMLGGKTT